MMMKKVFYCIKQFPMQNYHILSHATSPSRHRMFVLSVATTLFDSDVIQTTSF